MEQPYLGSLAPRATFSAVLAEDFLPSYDVSDEVATVVDADPQSVWKALMNADLLEVGKRVPLAGVLGALRMLPEIVSHLLHGELRTPPNRCAYANSPRCNPSKVAGYCSPNDRERSSHSASSASSGANPVVIQPGQSASCTFAKSGTYGYSDPNVKGKTFRGTVVVSGQPAGGSVTLQAKPQLVIYGAKVTLSGALSNHKAGETLQLLAQPCGQPSAAAAGSVTTGTNGVFSAQLQPLKNTVYTVKAKNSTSNAVTVKVRPRLRLRKLAPRRFSVRVLGAQSFAGKYATFQRYSVSLGRWLKVRRVLLRPNATGVAPTVISSATFKSRVKARLRVRVVLGQAQVGSCYLAGRSNVIRS